MGTEIMIRNGLDVTCLAARTVAAEMRQRMEFRLAAWGLMHIAHDAFLIADELITNACAATPNGEIRIRFTREPQSVVLGVWDSSDEMPTVKAVVELTLNDLDLSEENFDNNGGWGLPLVRALSCDCGVSKTNPRGKWVWARLTALAGK
jgi:two-component sensor histidine kinase